MPLDLEKLDMGKDGNDSIGLLADAFQHAQKEGWVDDDATFEEVLVTFGPEENNGIFKEIVRQMIKQARSSEAVKVALIERLPEWLRNILLPHVALLDPEKLDVIYSYALSAAGEASLSMMDLEFLVSLDCDATAIRDYLQSRGL